MGCQVTSLTRAGTEKTYFDWTWIAFIAIVTGGFLARVLMRWEILGYIPDSYEYALGAKELALSGRYLIKIGDLSYPPHYPIGLSLLLTPGHLLFKQNADNAIWTITILGTAGIPAVFLLARKLLGVKEALVASAIVGFYPLSVFFSGVVMSDIPAMLFVTLSLIGVIKSVETESYLILASLAAAFTFLLRPYLSLFILPSVLIYLIISGYNFRIVRNIIYLILSVIITVVPLIYYAWYMKTFHGNATYPLGSFPVFGVQYFITNLILYIKIAFVPIFPNILLPHHNNIDKIYLFLCVIFYLYVFGLSLWWKKGLKTESILFVLIPLTAFVFHLFFSQNQPRFFLSLTPLFILPASTALFTLIKNGVNAISLKCKTTKLRMKFDTLIIIFIMLWISNIFVFFYLPAIGGKIIGLRQDGHWQKEAAIWVRENTEKNAVIVTSIQPLVLGYYADRTVIPLMELPFHAYPRITESALANEIIRYREKGHPVYLVQERTLSWHLDATTNLYDIVTKFNIISRHDHNLKIVNIKPVQSIISKFGIYTLAKRGNFQVYEVGGTKSSHTVFLQRVDMNETWDMDTKWVKRPAKLFGTERKGQQTDFWLNATTEGNEMAWENKLINQPTKFSHVTMHVKSDSPQLFCRLIFEYSDGTYYTLYEGSIELNEWQKIAVPHPVNEAIVKKMKVYLKAPDDGSIHRLSIKSIKFVNGFTKKNKH